MNDEIQFGRHQCERGLSEQEERPLLPTEKYRGELRNLMNAHDAGHKAHMKTVIRQINIIEDLSEENENIKEWNNKIVKKKNEEITELIGKLNMVETVNTSLTHQLSEHNEAMRLLNSWNDDESPYTETRQFLRMLTDKGE